MSEDTYETSPVIKAMAERALVDAMKFGAAAERAAIVAWLRSPSFAPDIQTYARMFAHDIEQATHLRTQSI